MPTSTAITPAPGAHHQACPDSGMITVGVVEDESLLRCGIRGALERTRDIRVVAEAGAGPVTLVRRHRPRILLMAVGASAADGLAAVETVRSIAPATATILLAPSATDTYVQRALRAGAAGFLLKDGSPAELVTAVRATAAGGAVLSPSLTRRLVDRFASIDLEPVERARVLVGRLSVREREVLDLVANGLGNREIARQLYLSEGAVKAHISRLLTKLCCHNRVQAAIIAHSAKLLA